MSSETDKPAVRTRTRTRRLTSEETPQEAPRAVMDPGPMVHWPDLPKDDDGNPVAEAVRSRVRKLHAVCPEAATEFILEVLHMMLLQHRPVDDIARTFAVTTRTVWNWRKKLRERIGEDFRARTPSDAAAEQIASLKRTKAFAWQQAAKCSKPLDKQRWVATTIQCEDKISVIYERMKMYKAVEPVRDNSTELDNAVGALHNLAEEFLTGGYSGAKDSKRGKKATSKPDDDSDLVPEVQEDDALLF